MRRLASLIAFVLLTQGCGIKGPLYVETPEQRKKAEERRERREAAKQRDLPGAAPRVPRAGATPPPTAAAGTLEADPERVSSPDLTDEPFGPSVPPQ